MGFKAESETNLAALASASTAIEKGMSGSFLQTEGAKRVRQFAMESADLPDATRDELLSFLSGGGSQGYVPQSGEITGILKTLHDECDWLLKYFDARKEARAGEVEALHNAKAVLSGADYSLIQSKAFLVKRHVQ